ncbi:MAG TPA: helix-turn-helix domain-containing protein [Aeromicrobium sp.]|nr:helix-turn-helix domain-containing protein [Aeromicrobium sp.]
MGNNVTPATFRERLLVGLAASIAQRGFAATTIADIVREAQTSRRTFYAEFATREDCYVELLRATNETLAQRIADGVDPNASWRTQVRQAVDAYVDTASTERHLTLTWIRELPALGALGHDVQKAATDTMVDLVVVLSRGQQFAEAGISPLTLPQARLLIGGIRELTARTLEDGEDLVTLRATIGQAATALLAGR